MELQSQEFLRLGLLVVGFVRTQIKEARAAREKAEKAEFSRALLQSIAAGKAKP